MKFNSRLFYYISLALATLFLLGFAYQLWNIDLTAPMGYHGDTIFGYTLSKGVIENGWYLYNPTIGAPSGMDFHDYPIFDSLHFLIIKLMGYVFSNPILTVNLFYLLGFYLIAVSASIVFKHFGISDSVAFVFSLLYAFQPFHFLRGPGHLFLSGYFILPFVMMIIFWIFEGREFFQKSKYPRFKSRFLNFPDSTYFAFLILFLLSFSGVYYSFFSCLFILFAGISKSLKDKSWKQIISSMLFISIIFIGIVIQAIPNLFYKLVNGANPEALQRAFIDTEIYAFKPIQLLIPVTDHRVSYFAKIANFYNNNAPIITENSMSSLGIVGSCGLIFLIVLILFPMISNDKSIVHLKEKLKQLSRLNILGILYSTVGGIAAILAVWGFTNIRAVNRISIFLALFSLFTFALLLDIFLKSKKKSIIVIVLSFILIVGILDQVPAHLYNQKPMVTQFNIDKEFFKKVETNFKGGMIFQLPYLAFPESPVKAGWSDYGHFKAYLNTSTIKWSYGAMKGRPTDLWQRKTAGLEVSKMIPILKENNFTGIYVDKIGVQDTTLIISLEKELGKPDIISADSNLFIYKF